MKFISLRWAAGAVLVKTLLLALVLATGAQAAEGGIAVIDLQKIMRDSLASKSIREQIEKKREQFQSEITKDEDRLRKKDKDLAEQRTLLAPEKFEQERNSFKTEVENVQREVQKKRIQLDRAYAKALADVQDVITGIVKEVAAEQKFSLTLPAGQTLFYDPKMDITDTVLERLNKKLAKVTVKIEPVEDMDGGQKAAAPAKEAPKKK